MDESTLTHVAAILIGVVVTLALVNSFGNKTASSSDPKEVAVSSSTSTSRGGIATAGNDTKKKKKKKKKKGGATSAATSDNDVKDEPSDEEEEEEIPAPAPTANKKKKKKKATGTAVPAPSPQDEEPATPEVADAPVAVEAAAPAPAAGGGGKKNKKKKKAQPAASQTNASASAKNGTTTTTTTTNGSSVKKETEPKSSTAAAATTVSSDNDTGFWQSPPPVEEEWNSIKDTKKKKNRANRAAAGAATGATTATAATIPGMTGPSKTTPTTTASGSAPAAAAAAAATSDSVSIDAKKIGIIIGPKGATMNAIQEATGCKLEVNAPPKDEVTTASSSRKVTPAKATIMLTGGDKESIKVAKKAIQELATKGYATILQEDGFNESSIQVHPRYLKEIVGSGGKTIKALQSTLNVKITIPPTDWNPNAPPPLVGTAAVPSCKVGIAGTKDATKACKAAIQSLMEYHHHPITHPGMIHEEVHVPREFFHCVIGTRGSEIKHIRGNYKVDIYMPNDDSNTDNVIVVGPTQNVEKAISYIKLLMDRDTESRAQKYSDEYY